MKKFLYVFICLFGGLSYGTEVSLDVQPSVITVDDSAVISIHVRGVSNPPQPQIPKVSQCLTAPATTIRTDDATTFRFRIYPAESGKATIGPFDYAVAGQIYTLTTNLLVQSSSQPTATSNTTRESMISAEREANNVASEFIRGNTPIASNLVNQALARFPDDDKLLQLKKLIKEQQKQEQQKQDQQQDQKNQDQQKDQNKQDQQQNQDQQKDQSSQDQQDQQNQEQQKDSQGQQDQNTDQQPQDQQQSAQSKQAGEMSKEEAQQLLDAMKQDEQDQRANLKPFLGGPVRVDKDW